MGLRAQSMRPLHETQGKPIDQFDSNVVVVASSNGCQPCTLKQLEEGGNYNQRPGKQLFTEVVVGDKSAVLVQSILRLVRCEICVTSGSHMICVHKRYQ